MYKSSLTCIDNFCGAGGSTTGLKAAGIQVVHAANHWDRAIETHNTNHPEVDHSVADLNLEHPSRFPRTTIGWFSPSCNTHSPAGGRKVRTAGQLSLWDQSVPNPSFERSRMTAWQVVSFSEFHRYQVVLVENVVEFFEWELFDHWLKAMQILDYEHQLVFFNSQFAYPEPVPQSRDRLYIVFHRRGNRKPNVDFRPPGFCQHCQKEVNCVQTWKNQARRWGKYGERNQYLYSCPLCKRAILPHRKAASTALDWGLTSQRIGDREKPLSEATMQRIQRGLIRFSDQPFIDTARSNNQALGVDVPISTIQTSRHHSLITPQPFLSSYYGRGGESQVSIPAPTIRTKDGHALITPQSSVSLEDCCYRMLQPHEAKNLMGFAQDYVILGNHQERYRQVGNAVTPATAMLLGKAVVDSFL